MGLAQPNTVGVNATISFTGKGVLRFIAVTAGTVTIKRSDTSTVLNVYPVTAGSSHELNLFVDINGGTITTAGGASGVAVIC